MSISRALAVLWCGFFTAVSSTAFAIPVQVDLSLLARKSSTEASVVNTYKSLNRVTLEATYASTATNISTLAFDGPVYLVVESIAGAGVAVKNATDRTASGQAVFLISSGSFAANQIANLSIVFGNPSSVRFSFVTAVYATLPPKMGCTEPPVEVDPTIVIKSPIDGAAVAGDRVNITGTYSGPQGTGVTVNGVAAITDGYYFYVNNVPVDNTTTLQARAATPYGKSATSTAQITASGIAPIELNAAIDQGTAPLIVTFNYAFPGTAQTLSIDYDGDGLDDFTSTSASAALTTTYPNPGIYKPRLTITDTLGQIHTATTVIEATNPNADDAPFQQAYSRLRMALLCGDINGALAHLTEGAKERYQPVFEALAPHLGEILNSWSPLQKSEITDDYAEFAVNRLINGVNRIFFLYYLKDKDGVWRLDTM